jgi:hypothetical protein
MFWMFVSVVLLVASLTAEGVMESMLEESLGTADEDNGLIYNPESFTLSIAEADFVIKNYKIVDLFDARVAMDKKDYRNDYSFPTVKVWFVSEVIFKSQAGTTLTVATEDGILTERIEFGKRSDLKAGQKIRIFYYIAKDPLEKWVAQAIERL